MAAVDLQGVWLHDPSDPAGTVFHFAYNEDGAQESYAREMVLSQYAGREFPVVDYGEAVSQALAISLDTLDEDDDLDTLRGFLDRQTILCYRDKKGRRLYGALSLASGSAAITDTFYGATVQMVFTVTDFDPTVVAGPA